MIGFEEIEQKLTDNFRSHKLHHGIIISGKKGIGKATFVKNFCNKILNNETSFNADFAIIEKLPDKKNIGIENIRQKQQFLNNTSAISDYKFLIVDAVCELTKEASNALLKNLEEPKKNNFIILIAHQLGKVLPTIKSRCSIIKIADFSTDQFNEILHSNKIILEQNEQFFLSQICDNSPAPAIEFGSDLIKIYKLFISSILNQKIEEELLKKIGEKNFSNLIIEKILLYFLAQFVKKNNGLDVFFLTPEEQEAVEYLSSKFATRNILDLSNAIMNKVAEATKHNLDKKLNFINIFNLISYG